MEFQAYDIALIPIVIALVAIFKQFGLPVKYLPACSIVLGILFGIVYVDPIDPKKAILSGIVIGLAAIGSHSGVKNVVEKSKS